MIKKIKNIYLNLKNYFFSHQTQFLLFLILIILINYIPQIPYLNMLASPPVILLFLWILSVIIFRLTIRVSIVASLVLVITAFFLLILKKENIAELIGNLVYFLLLIIFGQSFWQYLKEVKSDHK